MRLVAASRAQRWQARLVRKLRSRPWFRTVAPEIKVAETVWGEVLRCGC